MGRIIEHAIIFNLLIRYYTKYATQFDIIIVFLCTDSFYSRHICSPNITLPKYYDHQTLIANNTCILILSDPYYFIYTYNNKNPLAFYTLNSLGNSRLSYTI